MASAMNGFERVVIVSLTTVPKLQTPLKYRNASKQKQKSSAIHLSTGASGILPWTRRIGFQKKTLRQETLLRDSIHF